MIYYFKLKFNSLIIMRNFMLKREIKMEFFLAAWSERKYQRRWHDLYGIWESKIPPTKSRQSWRYFGEKWFRLGEVTPLPSSLFAFTLLRCYCEKSGEFQLCWKRHGWRRIKRGGRLEVQIWPVEKEQWISHLGLHLNYKFLLFLPPVWRILFTILWFRREKKSFTW